MRRLRPVTGCFPHRRVSDEKGSDLPVGFEESEVLLHGLDDMPFAFKTW
jgi:hypothetical protein